MQEAEAKLAAEAEQLRAKLCLSRSTIEIVNDVKATMGTRLASQGQTVLQTLCERERPTFDSLDAAIIQDVRREFQDAVRDFLRSNEVTVSARKTRKFTDDLWRQNAATRGRPEIYDPSVLLAFADAIARAAGRPRFTTGHHGNTTLSDDKGGPLFRVLVAAVRWAMVIAWQSFAPPGAAPPIVKPEGILTALKRARASTD